MIHRPLITDHGTHCICGVFCGSKPESWDGHEQDLLTLHPMAETSNRPANSIDLLKAQLQRAGEAANAAIRGLKEAFSRKPTKGGFSIGV